MILLGIFSNLFSLVLWALALFMLARGVIAIRAAKGEGGLGPLIPGALLLGLALFLPHLSWSLLGLIIPALLMAGLMAFLSLQILKLLGKVNSVPAWGIAWAFADCIVVNLMHPAWAIPANSLWTLGAIAALAGIVMPSIFAPMVEARTREADAEIQRMQQASEAD